MSEAATAPKVLSIDDVINTKDLPTAQVDCPEWGGVVEVRALSRMEVVDTIEKCTDSETGEFDQSKYQLEIVIKGWGLTEDRYVQLQRKHSAPILRIANKVQELSTLGGTDARFPDSDAADDPVGDDPA